MIQATVLKALIYFFETGGVLPVKLYCILPILTFFSLKAAKYEIQKPSTCRAFPIFHLALHFFNPQQMFLLRVKLIAPGEKRETPTKTCNETMLRDKLRVFVSRIQSPP